MRRSASIAVATALLAACASAPRAGAPLHAQPEGGPLVRQGEEVFMANCEGCHPGAAAGFGPAIVRSTRIPDARVREQVRRGLGQMPAFDHDAISDEELNALVAYINALEATVDAPEDGALARTP